MARTQLREHGLPTRLVGPVQQPREQHELPEHERRATSRHAVGPCVKLVGALHGRVRALQQLAEDDHVGQQDLQLLARLGGRPLALHAPVEGGLGRQSLRVHRLAQRRDRVLAVVVDRQRLPPKRGRVVEQSQQRAAHHLLVRLDVQRGQQLGRRDGMRRREQAGTTVESGQLQPR